MASQSLADIPRPINPLEQQKLHGTIAAGLEVDMCALQEAQRRLLKVLKSCATGTSSDSFIETMFELVAKCDGLPTL